jgi:Uma2 family endonuclease
MQQRAPVIRPPLENGDRLSRREFMRRYEATPPKFKAERIEGVVYVSSPVRDELHGEPQSILIWFLVSYRVATPGVLTSDNSTLQLDWDNDPQPDGILRIDPRAGGRCRRDEDDYLIGAPELIAEVASSSASYDVGPKLDAYRRNGVLEYIVWRVLDEEIDWFVLEEGVYRPLEPDDSGVFKSRVFPGLWLNRTALLAGDLASLMQTLQQGIAAPEHDRFAAELRARMEPVS